MVRDGCLLRVALPGAFALPSGYVRASMNSPSSVEMRLIMEATNEPE